MLNNRGTSREAESLSFLGITSEESLFDSTAIARLLLPGPPAMRLCYIVCLLALLAPPLAAQDIGSCEIGSASADLEESDVRARVYNNGSLFFTDAPSVEEAQYIVPKESENSPIYAAGIWIGGEVDGDLRIAGATYDTFEFWPGPILGGQAPDDCSDYDRIWVVSLADLAAYEDDGTVTADLADWPVGLGAATVDASGDPVLPEGRFQTIDLEAGERPVLYGTQTAFWVMNDLGNDHDNNETPPLGIEVQVTAFSVIDPEDDAFNQGTFYRYRIVNRGENTIENTIASFFVDPDLGDAVDDYVGSDPSRSMAFVYNAVNTDNVYGTAPPAAGLDVLSGGNGAMYFTNLFGPTGDPEGGEDYYRFMQSLWGDGTPMTEGGDGYETDGPVTEWMFPGDPETEGYWSEVNVDGEGADNSPDDRRMLMSSEPFTLAPGESSDIDLAILFAQGTDHLNSVTELKAASDRVQEAYDTGMLFPEPHPVGAENGPAPNAALALSVAPNPSSDRVQVRFETVGAGEATLSVFDMLGREVVRRRPSLGAGAQSIGVSLSELPPGLYVVRVTAGGETASQRLTVMR